MLIFPPRKRGFSKKVLVMYLLESKSKKYCKCVRNDNDISVAPRSVVMTPQQALDMTAEGIPVSSQMANSELFFDGDENSDFVPLDRRRGVDIADIYNEVENIHSNFSNHFNNLRSERRKKSKEVSNGSN